MSEQLPRRETAGAPTPSTVRDKLGMTIHLPAHSHDLGELCRLERNAFAAKIRLARAVLGWSQRELGVRVGLTQRAIHKLEQGETDPRRTSARALEFIWREQNIEFEDLGGGGFSVHIRAAALERPGPAQARHHTPGRLPARASIASIV